MKINWNTIQQMAIHAIIVGAVAFGSVVASAGSPDWNWALLASGAAAAASAVLHMLVGLLPGTPTPAPAAKSDLIVPPVS